jgi:Eukaryotic aspartyl protease
LSPALSRGNDIRQLHKKQKLPKSLCDAPLRNVICICIDGSQFENREGVCLPAYVGARAAVQKKAFESLTNLAFAEETMPTLTPQPGSGQVAKVVRIPITNVLMNGNYTGVIQAGTDKKTINVILDTGSSSLGLDGNLYNPGADRNARTTNIVQAVKYGSGSWLGAVVQTDIAAGTGTQCVNLNQVSVAIAYAESSDMFGKANGILGLAYTRLDSAYTMPGATWPPKYNYNQIQQQGRVTFLQPYFTELEAQGAVANKFAFYTKRSMIRMKTPNPAADGVNQGFLLLGGGEESKDLYSGSFQSVDILDDDWYNTNLKAVLVGDSEPIEIPPPTKASTLLTNSIVDSGTNCLLLDDSLFQTITKRLNKGQDKSLTQAMRNGYLPMNSFQSAEWPIITFVLQGSSGDVKLAVSPENYWQTDAPEKGYASAAIMSDNGQLKGRSILGLPLMNGYLTIFDRSVDKGLGVIKFAPRK